jgi:hypothetical protein
MSWPPPRRMLVERLAGSRPAPTARREQMEEPALSAMVVFSRSGLGLRHLVVVVNLVGGRFGGMVGRHVRARALGTPQNYVRRHDRECQDGGKNT